MNVVRFFAVAHLAFGSGLASGAEPPSPTSAGYRVSKADYELDTTATSPSVPLNGEAPFSLRILPKNGTKVNLEAPLTLTLVENPAVAWPKATLGRSDLREGTAPLSPEWTTTLRGLRAGPTAIDVDVAFYLCTDVWCQPLTDRVHVPLVVGP